MTLLGAAWGAAKAPGVLTTALSAPEAAGKGKGYFRKLQDKSQGKKGVPTGSAPGAAPPMKKMSAKKALEAGLRKQAAPPPAAGMSLGKALMLGAGVAGGAAAVGGGIQGVGALHTKMKANRMFKELQRRHPEVKKHPKSREYFDMIVAYAPSLLRHPAAVGDFLRRQLEYPMSSVEFLKQLADLEKTVASTPSPGAEFTTSMAKATKPTEFSFWG